MSPTYNATPRSRFIIVDDGTVQDSRDEDETQRSRKRQRTSDGNLFTRSDRPSLKPDVDGTEILFHDPQYYFSDDLQANCYVRVEKILFKVHTYTLRMSNLLAMRLDNRTEPMSSKDPLELFGLSVTEFRALMWARHASEDDAKDQPRALDDLERLLSLATVTKNFEFHALHEWTLESLHRAFSFDTVLIDTCSAAHFTRVIEVATQFKATELLEAAVSKWCIRVRRGDTPAVPAILAADTHDLEKLLGVSYYTHLLGAIEQAPSPNSPTDPLRIQADPKLSAKQVIKLLSGHLSLVNFTEKYKRRPAKLACAEGCTAEAHRACTVIWNERWGAAAGSRKVLSYCSADTLGIVGEMSDQLVGDLELIEGVAQVCRVSGLKSLKQVLVDEEKNLPQHFRGCFTPPPPSHVYTEYRAPPPEDDFAKFGASENPW